MKKEKEIFSSESQTYVNQNFSFSLELVWAKFWKGHIQEIQSPLHAENFACPFCISSPGGATQIDQELMKGELALGLKEFSFLVGTIYWFGDCTFLGIVIQALESASFRMRS